MSISNPNFSTVNRETLSDAKTLDWDDADIQVLDPGGATRAITLPTVGDQEAGARVVIANAADADETLTVTAVQLATDQATTIGQGEVGMFFYTGYTSTVGVPGNARTNTDRLWVGGILTTT